VGVWSERNEPHRTIRELMESSPSWALDSQSRLSFPGQGQKV